MFESLKKWIKQLEEADTRDCSSLFQYSTTTIFENSYDKEKQAKQLIREHNRRQLKEMLKFVCHDADSDSVALAVWISSVYNSGIIIKKQSSLFELRKILRYKKLEDLKMKILIKNKSYLWYTRLPDERYPNGFTDLLKLSDYIIFGI